MSIHTGNSLGVELLEALGANTPDVESLVIKCHPGRAATATITRFMKNDTQWGKIVEHYELVRKQAE